MKPQLVTYIKKVQIVIADAENSYDLLNKCNEQCPEGFELLEFCDNDSDEITENLATDNFNNK